MDTRNCLGNLTKSPGKEGEGVGERVNLHGPAYHYPTPGGGGEYTPGRLRQQERR